MDAKEEIKRALDSVVNGGNPIRVIPSPEFQYCFTCWYCGCHTASHCTDFNGNNVDICRCCGEAKS